MWVVWVVWVVRWALRVSVVVVVVVVVGMVWVGVWLRHQHVVLLLRSMVRWVVVWYSTRALSPQLAVEPTPAPPWAAVSLAVQRVEAVYLHHQSQEQHQEQQQQQVVVVVVAVVVV